VLYVILYKSLVMSVWPLDSQKRKSWKQHITDFSDVYFTSLGKTKVQNEEVRALKKLEFIIK